tara:strand:- start:500 stop:1558 length:1059 start_codon:yes stop_codon:yes gene_type:complete
MAYTDIDDPSAHFQVTTYTGAGANQTVTNGGNSNLQPDWLWIKRRNAGYAHALFDSNRGLGSSNPPMLESDSTAVENANQNWISGVGTDSFTIGVNEHNLSNTAGTYVAWQWKCAGGTTSSNSAGDISSTVQVNSTAGFSIVSYTGNFTATQTVGHGLGVTPDLVIIKNRDTAVDWVVWSPQLSSGNFLRLNTSAAQSSSSRIHQSGFTATTFGIGANNSVNKSGDDLIAYCFAEKQGYSKIGKYIGNSEGAFAYCGFAPIFIMVREIGNTNSWWMFDRKRDPFNTADARLAADQTSAEATGSFTNVVEFLSNGFKFRNTDSAWNRNAGEYLFIAFAEHPLVTSGGAPCPAR